MKGSTQDDDATEFDGLTYKCKSCGKVTDSPSVNDLPLFGCAAGGTDTHNWVRTGGNFDD